MPLENSFQHTDNRVFRFIKEVQHVTRDGRGITLKVWATSCSWRGCPSVLEVRTATDQPQSWPHFKPAKYCPHHRPEAARLNRQAVLLSPEGKKAQADGFRKWLASPERQKSLLDRLGVVEKAVLNAAEDYFLVTDKPSVADILSATVKALPAPEKDRDTRYNRALRALNSVVRKKVLHLADGGAFVVKKHTS